MPYKNKEDKLNHNYRYFRFWYERNGKTRNRNEDYISVSIRWQRDNPEKVRVAARLRYAVKIGRVLKSDCCQKCGRETRLAGHHEDYSKSLQVTWLCNSCHKLEHSIVVRI